MIGRLAKEEGQNEIALLTDIATSLDITERIYNLLSTSGDLHPRAQLYIRVYDEIPYFAFHKQDEKVIIGFYFTTNLGSESSAFEIINNEARLQFEEHFTTIFNSASATTLLEISSFRGKPKFNEELFSDLYHALCDSEKLGREATEIILGKPRYD